MPFQLFNFEKSYFVFDIIVNQNTQDCESNKK